jgi:hypothetical protein
MPGISRDSAAHVETHGPVGDRHEELDGYSVNGGASAKASEPLGGIGILST